MKRRIILSIALIASVVALIKFNPAVSAEPPQKFVWDSGIVTLGNNQILRVVSVDGELGGGLYGEVIRRFEYQQTTCETGSCKYAVASQTTTPPLTIAPNEAVSIDTPPGGTRRIAVLTNNRNVRVNASIIDAVTGEVVSFTTDLVIDVSG
jgi:hypothetical protein